MDTGQIKYLKNNHQMLSWKLITHYYQMICKRSEKYSMMFFNKTYFMFILSQEVANML